MDCRYCKFCVQKVTAKNKINYGLCERTKLILLAVQTSCKIFKKMG